ncbi:methyl-accepting chemotaxis protein [Methylorubrum extorquens]|uniref:Methyl-accepting chemotaxis sensory transducer n=1 Tax=Methylorubrum extorquens DSM 13060 TaxID=882800 RepID=H1KBY9_METEX|nr:methyl-accepting chemotaxis protein [Methylorubrum extorquens]EHP94986.1 methyl-accepting chemotaxis sensory transducer [Methylorubrum extorquens DSM 13060]
MPTTFGLNRTLGSAIGAIALVSILSSGAVLHALNQLHDATEARRRVVLVLRDLDAFRTAMLNQETGLRGYLITGKDSSLEPYRGGRAALNEVANRLRGFVGTDAEPSKLLEEAIVAAQTWQKDIGEAAIRLAADPATRPDAVRIEAEGKGKQFFDTLREKLAAIEATEEKNRLVETERLAGAERDAKITLWLGALLTLVFCAGIGIAINRWIVRPLGGVLGFVERVGTGDLTGRTAVTGRDEVGRLGTTLNAMVAGLSDLARSNRSATADLNAAAAEIRASAQQQAASVEEQFAAVQETAATIDEISQSGAQISKRATEVIATAQTAAQTARSGLRAAGDTAKAMDAIREQGEAVAGNIVALSEKTQAIGEIIVTVNDISERTHLLALNAAIEAASAGEQGLSFTVVASEMKLLADQAKGATAQVRGILGEIQRGINTSVMLTEEAVKRAAAGKTRTDATVRTIEEMAARVEESVHTFQQIVASTNQQLLGIEQVTGALHNIRQASQQTAAGTREVETASANLTELAGELLARSERYRI